MYHEISRYFFRQDTKHGSGSTGCHFEITFGQDGLGKGSDGAPEPHLFDQGFSLTYQVQECHSSLGVYRPIIPLDQLFYCIGDFLLALVARDIFFFSEKLFQNTLHPVFTESPQNAHPFVYDPHVPPPPPCKVPPLAKSPPPPGHRHFHVFLDNRRSAWSRFQSTPLS